MKSLIAGLLLTAPVLANAYTWTDTYDAGPNGLLFPQLIQSGQTVSWLHDITDAASNSFQPGSDLLTDFSITLLVSDDSFLDGSEKEQLKIEGLNVGAARDVPLVGLLNYNGNTTLNWLAGFNSDGKLNISLTSTLGDFYFFGSVLEATGTKAATSVPEPTSIALLAAGLLGIAVMRRKNA
jgi:hypothetical protein